MKKLFSWGKALPVLGASLLVAGALAFAVNGSGSAHNQGNPHNSAKYVLTLTEAAAEPTEATPAEEEENGDENATTIELNSYRFLEDEPEGPTAEAAVVTDFGNNNLRFMADSGPASPMLFAKVNTGEVIPEATLVVKKSKWSHEFMTFNMTNLVVTSYQNTASQDADDTSPQDIVVLSYETLEILHDENEGLKEGWNFKKDKET